MATPTYIPLATVTLASSAFQVNFGAISQDYRDLVLVVEAVDDGTTFSPLIFLTFNGDSGANYNFVKMRGTGSSASSTSITGRGYIEIGSDATPTNGRALVLCQIMDYSATDKHTTVLNRANNADTGVSALAARWENTAAITSMTIDAFTSRSFDAGSTFTLYGIASEAA